jgi:hypothetical protein
LYVWVSYVSYTSDSIVVEKTIIQNHAIQSFNSNKGTIYNNLGF